MKDMLAEQFDQTIRRFIKAKPFQPFVIVMNDGRLVHVVVPKAAMSSGGAGLVDADGELQLIECEQVQELRLAREELAK